MPGNPRLTEIGFETAAALALSPTPPTKTYYPALATPCTQERRQTAYRGIAAATVGKSSASTRSS